MSEQRSPYHDWVRRQVVQMPTVANAIEKRYVETTGDGVHTATTGLWGSGFYHAGDSIPSDGASYLAELWGNKLLADAEGILRLVYGPDAPTYVELLAFVAEHGVRWDEVDTCLGCNDIKKPDGRHYYGVDYNFAGSVSDEKLDHAPTCIVHRAQEARG